MITAAGFLGGILVAGGLWVGLRGTFASDLFARENHRGRSVPVGAGILIALTALAAAAVDQGLLGLGWDLEPDLLPVAHPLLAAVLGFGLLGLVDDLAETGQTKGFAGHLRALRHGQLTTGGLKLLGGGALALAVVGAVDADRPRQLLVDALLVALAANLGNLLDRAPGRTTKVGLVVGGILLLTHLDPAPVGLPVVLGAAAGLLAFDLRERMMLGDAGANVLGAAIGLAAVEVCSTGTRTVALAVVLALNAASEWVSFSSVIDRVRPLRALDRLGRHG